MKAGRALNYSLVTCFTSASLLLAACADSFRTLPVKKEGSQIFIAETKNTNEPTTSSEATNTVANASPTAPDADANAKPQLPTARPSVKIDSQKSDAKPTVLIDHKELKVTITRSIRQILPDGGTTGTLAVLNELTINNEKNVILTVHNEEGSVAGETLILSSAPDIRIRFVALCENDRGEPSTTSCEQYYLLLYFDKIKNDQNESLATVAALNTQGLEKYFVLIPEDKSNVIGSDTLFAKLRGRTDVIISADVANINSDCKNLNKKISDNNKMIKILSDNISNRSELYKDAAKTSQDMKAQANIFTNTGRFLARRALWLIRSFDHNHEKAVEMVNQVQDNFEKSAKSAKSLGDVEIAATAAIKEYEQAHEKIMKEFSLLHQVASVGTSQENLTKALLKIDQNRLSIAKSMQSAYQSALSTCSTNTDNK